VADTALAVVDIALAVVDIALAVVDIALAVVDIALAAVDIALAAAGIDLVTADTEAEPERGLVPVPVVVQHKTVARSHWPELPQPLKELAQATMAGWNQPEQRMSDAVCKQIVLPLLAILLPADSRKPSLRFSVKLS